MASAVTTRLSRDDFRKAKELEELRKTGAAPPELDAEGRIINPHIPQYISSAPWYYNSTRPGLKHQYLSKYKPPTPTPSIYTPNKLVIVKEQRNEYVKGACENCGSMTHRVKECLERPRKKGAKWGGEVVGRDEVVQQAELDYDGKRDRWKGYDSKEYNKVIDRYEKAELERKKKKLEELEAAYRQDQLKQEHNQQQVEASAEEERKKGEVTGQGQGVVKSEAKSVAELGVASAEEVVGEGVGQVTEGGEVGKGEVVDVKESDLDKLKRIKREKRLLKLRKKIALATSSSDPLTSSSSSSALPLSSDSDSDSDSGTDDEMKDYGEVITKMDTKNRVTVRNLRIREDTAKYLRNLDPNSAHYDPKTRSMRQNPYTDKRPDEVLYAGDNFVRGSGDVKEIARLQQFVWDNEEKGAVDVHAVALPSATERLWSEHKESKEREARLVKGKILQAYGGAEHLTAPAAVLRTSEAYVEYDDEGRVVKGGERVQVRSKYAEDVLEGGHKAVWGSWWDRKEARWGYACCRGTIRGCICVGEVGKQMKQEMDKEREKREVKEDEAVRGEKRKREDEVSRPSTSTSSAAIPFDRYGRAPSEREMDTHHREQRRSDDPMNSYRDTT